MRLNTNCGRISGGGASWEPTTAAMDGFLLSPEKKLTAGGCVTSAPRKITGSLKTFGRMLGTKILLTPPNLTLIFRHKLDKVCAEVLLTFLAWTHWVATPRTVSPTRLTSAYTGVLPGKTTTTNCNSGKVLFRYRNIGSTWSGPFAYLQKQGWPIMGIPASFEIL